MFLTSTFAFRSVEEGADFFDIVVGRKPAPEGMGAGRSAMDLFRTDRGIPGTGTDTCPAGRRR